MSKILREMLHKSTQTNMILPFMVGKYQKPSPLNVLLPLETAVQTASLSESKCHKF